MKVRNGFVSNSSSSSFIIQIEKDGYINDESPMLANKECIPLLEKKGFIKTSRRSPFSDMPHNEYPKHMHYMYYHVSCNQEDIIEFLVKNNIPFKASCHYGHYFAQFQKDDNEYLKAYNFGKKIDMYGFSGDCRDWKEICQQSKVEIVWVGHLIKDSQNEN